MLFEGQYRKAKAKGQCPNTKAAVLIDGKGAGSIFYLCQTEKCDVHNRVTRYQPTPQEQAQRTKEAVAERVEKLARVRVLEAIRKKLPDALSRPDLEMVALDYSGVWATTIIASLQALRLGREEEQNLMGRSSCGLRENRGGCRASHENRRS